MAHRRYTRARTGAGSGAAQSVQGRSGEAFRRNPGRGLRDRAGAGLRETEATLRGPAQAGGQAGDPAPLAGVSQPQGLASVHRRRAGTRGSTSAAAEGGAARVGAIRGREVLGLRRAGGTRL